MAVAGLNGPKFRVGFFIETLQSPDRRGFDFIRRVHSAVSERALFCHGFRQHDGFMAFTGRAAIAESVSDAGIQAASAKDMSGTTHRPAEGLVQNIVSIDSSILCLLSHFGSMPVYSIHHFRGMLRKPVSSGNSRPAAGRREEEIKSLQIIRHAGHARNEGAPRFNPATGKCNDGLVGASFCDVSKKRS